MEAELLRLKRRAQILGNHYKKYIFTIEKYVDDLADRLERHGLFETVHLWAHAHSYRDEMRLVCALGKTLEEKKTDLGCYFALQYLQMNLSALEALALELANTENRVHVYREFMLSAGHDFRKLIAAFMEQLLALFLPEEFHGEYVFLGVGARADQDDIDLGVVDSGMKDRDLLNTAIAHMNTEMLKRAISPHYYISEHVCKDPSFSTSIEEYNQLLSSGIHDFITITEMLSAARVMGSRNLFFDFRRKITTRYYYNPDDRLVTKFHEGYLRGIIGETRSFMFREFSGDRLNLKNDGIRMIKGGLYAAKSIYNLRHVNPWALLTALQTQDKRRALYYQKMEVSLTYLEIFRYLYHLLVAQEEEIQLTDPSTYNNLAIVAEYMGYKNDGALSATDYLIADYYNKAKLAKGQVKRLLPDAIKHLEYITTFGKLLYHKKVTADGENRIGNLAERFLNEVEFFCGTRFWDDIITVLERKDGIVLGRLINDLCRDRTQTDVFLQKFGEWGWNSYIALFSFINLLFRNRQKNPKCTLAQRMVDLFLNSPIGVEEAQRFSVVFLHHPLVVHEFIGYLREEEQRQFCRWLNYELWDRQVHPARDRLRYLIKLHYATSKFFKHTMERALEAHPDTLRYLNDPKKMAIIGKGLLAQMEQSKSHAERLNRIGLFHNFEYLRVCLLMLSGTSLLTIADEYIEFADTYIRLLFDICKHDVDSMLYNPAPSSSIFGVFVAGGCGHMLAFDDDYDMVILVDSDDEDVHDYYLSIVKKMHKEIVKTGIMPHYRLSEYTSSYICSIRELKALMKSDNPETFIDKSQILGARMIVGSSVLNKKFQKDIVRPFIFDKKSSFIKSMLNEIDQRHISANTNGINLKEDVGGLRDIEMFLDVLRALFEISEHSNFRLFKKLQAILPKHGRELKDINFSYEFLRFIRNLNRLTVTADDQLNPEYIGNLTENLIGDLQAELTPDRLISKVKETMRRVSKIINKLREEIITEPA